jgi:integrase
MSGGGGIRTHERAFTRCRFSRPVRSTAPPPRRTALDRSARARSAQVAADWREVARASSRASHARSDARRLIEVLPVADRVVWGLAFYAGLRRGELLALRWRDVDTDAATITVDRAWCSHSRTFTAPKSGAGRRVVPAAAELRRLLLEHRLLVGAASREPDALVIVGRFPGRPASASMVGARARTAWAELDAAGVTLHAARHTYASLMVEAGVGFKALQTYMGHSSITITLDRYAHLLPGALAQDALRLDSLLDAGE